MLVCSEFCIGCADKLMDVEVWYCSVKIPQMKHSAEQVVRCSQPTGGQTWSEKFTGLIQHQCSTEGSLFVCSIRHLPHVFIENVVRPVH